MGFVFAATLAIWLAVPLAAQISPGPLARPHQQLEGVSKCATCHDFGAGTRGFRCLDCHAEIRRRVEARAGFHGRAYKPSAGQTDCARCHMEHNGREFVLARLEQRNFDHAARTGFVLEGTHRQQKCEACHTERRIAAPERAEIKVKNLSRTFLGLRRDCLSCHQDQHRGQLGADCTGCHSQQAWKPAPGFSHARTGFPLTGLHQAVRCQACHTARAADEGPRYKGLTFSGCQGCHSDPHRGAFQDSRSRGSCEGCHNTTGWKNSRPAANFRHDTTAFPLRGKHAAAACSACHKTADFRKPIAHERCMDCHQDPHRGQFAGRAAGSDCAACHTENGFKPARFDRETHNLGPFSLEGKHSALACAQCHQPAGRDALYVNRKLVCSACHSDRHGGEFAGPPYANQCELCHTTAGFQPPTFTATRHQQTRFALTGRHAAVACHACHQPLAVSSSLSASTDGGSATPPRQYRFPSLDCAACHADPHRTDRSQNRVACQTCHTTEQWQSPRPFDHSATGFRLEEAHQKARCIACHVSAGSGAGLAVKVTPEFAKRSSRCASCHLKDDAHSGQFQAAEREEDCASCHTAAAWLPAAFHHDTARFALDVAHRNVACAKCHKPRKGVDGRMIPMYRGTPVECVQCH